MNLTSDLALHAGAPMPDFSLPMVSAQGTRACSRQDLLGQPFVLFVYPKDATCDCTLVAQEFRDRHAEFQSLSVQVLGLSRDSVGAHRKFIAAQEFPFALLSDATQETMKSWGLIYHATMYGKPVTKVRRTTILANAEGIVQLVWEKVSPQGHAAQVLEACRGLRRS